MRGSVDCCIAYLCYIGDLQVKALKLYNLAAFHGLRLTEETANGAADMQPVDHPYGGDARTVGGAHLATYTARTFFCSRRQ
jgi:ribosomal protein L2